MAIEKVIQEKLKEEESSHATDASGILMLAVLAS